MIQVIGRTMGSELTPFFADLFLSHKEADWVKAQRKLGAINIRKISNSFRFIDGLLSLNDDSVSEKHKNILFNRIATEERKNSCASFLDIYMCIENG